MAVLPLAMLWLRRVPVGFAFRRVLVLCPFIALLCLAGRCTITPFHRVAVGPWQWEFAGGWLTAPPTSPSSSRWACWP